jgi:hypothetical protein
MAVWFMPWLHCGDTRQTDTIQADTIQIVGGIARAALRRIDPVSHRTATGSGTAGTSTNHRRDNVLRTRIRVHALNHGGAMD